MGPRMPPMATAAATPEPDMAPKSMLATMLVWARAPGRRWATSLAQPTRRRAMPPEFIRLPASTKKGMASREKELTLWNIFCAEIISALVPGMMIYSAAAEPIPMLRPMGKPTARVTKMSTIITVPAKAVVVILSPPIRLSRPGDRSACACLPGSYARSEHSCISHNTW